MTYRADKTLHDREIFRVLLAALGLLVLFNVPWLPQQSLGMDLDSSWIMTLHHAFAQGFHWGSDIVWHYGPLGFLYGKYYHPDTYYWLLFYYIVVTLAFWAGIAWLWRQKPVNPMVPIGAAILVILSEDLLFMAFSLMLLTQYFWVERRLNHPAFWLLLFFSALAGWMKFSYLLAALAVVLGIEAHRIMKEKIPGAVLLPFTVMLLLLWWILGQRTADLPPYLQGAWELGRGFDAMAGNFLPEFFAWLFLGLVGAWILAAGQVLKRRGQREEAVGWWVATIVLALLMLKAGFIQNNDHHLMQAAGWFFLLALLTKDFFWKERSALGNLFIIFFAALSVLMVGGFYSYRSQGEVERVWGQMAQLSSADSGLSADHFSWPSERFRQTQHTLRQRVQFSAEGTADIYNHYQNVLFAQESGLKYQPRPVFQSYHVYTPYLARLNRDFLRGERAPEHIFYRADNILTIFPAEMDGLSWPELLTRYDIKEVKDGYLHLRKTEMPRSHTLTPYAEIETGWNQRFEIPQADQGPVWAQLEWKENWKSKLLRMLFRRPPLEMRFELAGGYVRTDRIAPDALREGFLLSPLVDNGLHLAMLGTELRQALVQRNAITHATLSYSAIPGICRSCIDGDRITLRFYRLDFPAQESAGIAGWAEVASYALMSSGMPPQEVKVGLAEAVHLDFRQAAGQPVLASLGEAAMSLPLDPANSSLRFEASNFIAFGHVGGYPPAVDLRVEGVHSGGREMLWQATLPEVKPGEKAETVTPEIAFAPGRFRELIFSAHPQSPGRLVWTYWTKVEVK